MKIRSIDKDIKDILESGFYRIPRFQRPYSWDRENIEDFWTDVIVNADADYFIGGMVVFKAPTSDTAGVVYGQQRLTTITMILAALRNAFKAEGLNDLAGGVHRLIERFDINNKALYVLQTETSYPYQRMNIEHVNALNPPGSVTDPRDGGIGNLILTEPGFNTKLGNKPFAQKIDLLKRSKIFLDPTLESASQWTAKQIQQRGQWLAKNAYETVWKL